MNQAAKTWLIAGAVLLLVGMTGFVCVMSLNGWNFAAFSDSEFITTEVDIREAFESISIRSDTEDIAFVPSENGKCSVVFHEKAKERHSASVKGGTLQIEQSDTRTWKDRISFFSFGTPTITLYLPQGGYGSLFIEESTGDISIPKEFTFENMDLSSSTGNVDCSASASGPVRIAAGTGDIRIGDISAGSLDLSVSTGKVEVRSAACSGDVSVTVGTGQTVLSGLSCRNLSSSGDTGRLTMEDVICTGTLTVERSTGDVRFERCDASELQITTSTGDVTGSLLSEKVFIPRSSTGKINVPETVAGGKCKVTTNTGEIAITVP